MCAVFLFVPELHTCADVMLTLVALAAVVCVVYQAGTVLQDGRQLLHCVKGPDPMWPTAATATATATASTTVTRRRHNVSLLAYSPLAGGALTGKYLTPNPPATARFNL